MFGRKNQPTSPGNQVGTFIGSDTSFKGNITSESTIRIDGHYEGELSTAGDIVIGENGRLETQMKARNAVIAGVVNGSIDVADKLELLPTAKVYADLKTGMLNIHEGAIFRGACQMRHDKPAVQEDE